MVLLKPLIENNLTKEDAQFTFQYGTTKTFADNVEDYVLRTIYIPIWYY